MSQKTRNGDIKSFFKPASRPTTSHTTASPGIPTSEVEEPPEVPSPKLPPLSTSLPTSPSPLASPLASRSKQNTPTKSREIAASDDDDDDSESSFDDLSALFGRPQPAVANQSTPSRDPFATPRAKRTAVEFHSSPLTYLPKHKFDLKALVEDAKKDEATSLSAMRARAAMQSDSDEEQFKARQNSTHHSSVFATVAGEEGGKKAKNVMRAIQRAAPAESRKQYYFFNPGPTYKAASSSPPAVRKESPWRMLATKNARAREQCVTSGLLHSVLKKTDCGLPDELFVWVLGEILTEKSALMRQEYLNLIAESPKQVGALITDEVLEGLFLRAGATEVSMKLGDKVPTSSRGHDPYEGRDWSGLESFITLLGLVAHQLAVKSILYALSALVQMSMDEVVSINVRLLSAYEEAVYSLVEALPGPQWNSFCHDIASQIHTSVEKQATRMNALTCLPMRGKKVHDLRRRLAVACLFDEPSLSRSRPDDIVTVKDITSLLRTDTNVFTIREGTETQLGTDFSELKASVLLLDIALDEGSYGCVSVPAIDEKAFNEDVDELAQTLRGLWRNINDAGMKLARTEAKGTIEWVEKRVTHSVRTRRKPKTSVFDLPGYKEDPLKQQSMMSFLKNESQA